MKPSSAEMEVMPAPVVWITQLAADASAHTAKCGQCHSRACTNVPFNAEWTISAVAGGNTIPSATRNWTKKPSTAASANVSQIDMSAAAHQPNDKRRTIVESASVDE